MVMRAKFINEFERGIDPKHALGIGRVAKIQKLFRDADIPDEDYNILSDGVIFYGDLWLCDKNIIWLPDNLKIDGKLDLSFTTIAELPKGLQVKGYLNLGFTGITELSNDLKILGDLYLNNSEIKKLPDGLYVRDCIFVKPHQEELIRFIESSKFANKLQFVR